MRSLFHRAAFIAVLAIDAVAICSGVVWLSGCATKPAQLPPPAPSCLALKAYSQDQLDAMASAIRALPADSPLRKLSVDYGQLRDEARAACSLPQK